MEGTVKDETFAPKNDEGQCIGTYIESTYNLICDYPQMGLFFVQIEDIGKLVENL